MRLLIDASGASYGGLATIVASLVAAWRTTDDAATDELHVVASSRFVAQARRQLVDCHIHAFEPNLLGRLRAQYWLVRSVAGRVNPDSLLATLPLVPIGPMRCPIFVVCYDLRHELNPSEFSRVRLLARAIEYRRAYRRASKIVAISKRTAADLVALHPDLAAKVVVVPLGSDHLPPYKGNSGTEPGLALAYAQHPNKRPELAIRAWALLQGEISNLPVLTVIGASASKATELHLLAESLNVPPQTLVIRGIVDEDEVARTLGASRLLVFPSSFEGFGLPILEALRNRVPVVVTPDPALIEVGGPFVTVADGDSAQDLAHAVKAALITDSLDRRIAGAAWAERFTWRSTASSIRKLMLAST